MIKVTSVTWSLQDDVVFENPSLSLYATGCKWKCKGCYNKSLWDFNNKDSREYHPEKMIEYLNNVGKHLSDITIVGIGGDFWFQLDQWLQFCSEIKKQCPDVKIVWYTGAEYEMKPSMDLSMIDAILWGQLKNTNGKVYKVITRAEKHDVKGEIFINDYDSTYEESYTETQGILAHV